MVTLDDILTVRNLVNCFDGTTFVFHDSNLIEDEFLSFCKARGLGTLKGHRSIGGFRASIYNAMPESGIDALIKAMREYEKL